MSSKNPFKAISPSAWVADKVGISNKNTLWGLVNPGGVAARNAAEGYDQGGSSAVLNQLRSGDLTDPGGHFHVVGGAEVNDPGAAAQEDSAQTALRARDRVRRAAYRAQGRASTIKVGSAAEPFTGQQKTLLGS